MGEGSNVDCGASSLKVRGKYCVCWLPREVGGVCMDCGKEVFKKGTETQ